VNLVRTVMTQLVATGHVQRAVMGIGIADAGPDDAQAVGLPQIRGVVVTSYSDESPARDAGVQLGDVIVALDGQPVEYVAQLQQRVGFKKPGETVEVTVLRRGGERKTFRVRLAQAPTERDSTVASRGGSGGANSDKAGLGLSRRGDKLGIGVEPVSQEDLASAQLKLAQRNGGGLVVTDVTPDGPAYGRLVPAGTQGGPDIILQVNGAPVRTRADLATALAKVRPGDVVDLLVLRQTPDDGWAQQFVRIRAR
jgi:serine protease Do